MTARPLFSVGDAVAFETELHALSGTVCGMDYRGRERGCFGGSRAIGARQARCARLCGEGRPGHQRRNRSAVGVRAFPCAAAWLEPPAHGGRKAAVIGRRQCW